MDVSVIICTWNRERLLRQTLERMKSMRVPEGTAWELLVVNNNCTDETDGVLEEYSSRLPIRRLFEPTPGKCNACNCAVAGARGELLLWTDDDVLVDGGWLEAYADAARRYPEATYFGGLIEPWFEHDPPDWIRENLEQLLAVFALRDCGPEMRPFRAAEFPYGANMATRKAAFEHTSFDPRLGPHLDQRVIGDETTMLQALQDRGDLGIWVAGARVKHYVPASRLTREYVWKFHVGAGRTLVVTGGATPGATLFGAPRWLYRQYLTLRLKSLWMQLWRRTRWVDAYIRAAITRGMIFEYRTPGEGNVDA